MSPSTARFFRYAGFQSIWLGWLVELDRLRKHSKHGHVAIGPPGEPVG
jgi:hypothetical protein